MTKKAKIMMETVETTNKRQYHLYLIDTGSYEAPTEESHKNIVALIDTADPLESIDTANYLAIDVPTATPDNLRGLIGTRLNKLKYKTDTGSDRITRHTPIDMQLVDFKEKQMIVLYTERIDVAAKLEAIKQGFEKDLHYYSS
ncbi:MAG: hypothetical protein GOU99_00900 [Candidatus Altiarchaeota archaeon]|nr:hypothetical protein [Candidatus Altiarchaeota archaeon]